MMQFKHINDVKCPVCNSDIRTCSITGTHANGEQFETVEFKCGHSYSYLPNYSDFRTNKECPNTEEEKKRVARIQEFKAAIIALVKKHKVSDEDATALFSSLSFNSDWKIGRLEGRKVKK